MLERHPHGVAGRGVCEDLREVSEGVNGSSVELQQDVAAGDAGGSRRATGVDARDDEPCFTGSFPLGEGQPS